LAKSLLLSPHYETQANIAVGIVVVEYQPELVVPAEPQHGVKIVGREVRIPMM
jgi:hypothetical protein